MQGTILRGIGSFYYVLDDAGEVHQVRAQRKLRRERLKPKVGDRVEITPGEGEEDGWIHGIMPRRSELVRPPVANIDVVVIVAAAAAPLPDLMMVDRLMLNARRAHIDVQLVISKCDLDEGLADDIVNQYRGAACDPVKVSAVTGEGIDALRQRLAGRVHALAGQSGAGKSTLINALYGLDLETGGPVPQDRPGQEHHPLLRADPRGGRRHGAGHPRLQPAGDRRVRPGGDQGQLP